MSNQGFLCPAHEVCLRRYHHRQNPPAKAMVNDGGKIDAHDGIKENKNRCSRSVLGSCSP